MVAFGAINPFHADLFSYLFPFFAQVEKCAPKWLMDAFSLYPKPKLSLEWNYCQFLMQFKK